MILINNIEEKEEYNFDTDDIDSNLDILDSIIDLSKGIVDLIEYENKIIKNEIIIKPLLQHVDDIKY